MTIKIEHSKPLNSSDKDVESEGDLAVVQKPKIRRPKKFKVLLHNDDYTTMEFVVYILQKIFKKSEVEAHDIMIKVHTEGVGVCGLYSFEIAESKATQVNQLARKQGHPLKCSIEEDAE